MVAAMEAGVSDSDAPVAPPTGTQVHVPELARPAPGPLQQVLLTTDGNVGRILEAYTGGPIEAVKLEQYSAPCPEEPTALDLATGDEVLWRRALLRASTTHQSLLYAEAMIAVDRLHPVVREGLLTTSETIGRLLLAIRAETFREILSSSTEPAGALGAHFGVDEDDCLFERTYRIIADGQPMVLITERFPTAWFQT